MAMSKYLSIITLNINGLNVPIKKNPKRTTSRHIIIKMAKFQDKDRILKAIWEKQDATLKGDPIRIAADFTMETLDTRVQENAKEYSR